jgi:hypothetical protein
MSNKEKESLKDKAVSFVLLIAIVLVTHGIYTNMI